MATRIIFIFSVFTSYVFAFSPLRFSRRVFSSPRCESDDNDRSNILLRIPPNVFQSDFLIKYLHEWASDVSTLGDAIKPKFHSTGVKFIFTPPPGSSTLDVWIDNCADGDGVVIKTKVSLGIGSQIASLVSFSSNYIIESLSNDITCLVIESSDRSKKEQKVTALTEADISSAWQEAPVTCDEFDAFMTRRQSALEPTNNQTMDESSEYSRDYDPGHSTVETKSTEREQRENSPSIFPPMGNDVDMSPAVESRPRPSRPLRRDQNVVYSWDNSVNPKSDNAAKAIVDWAKTFAARGAGIEFVPQHDGIVLSFAIADTVKLSITVGEYDEKLCVIAEQVEDGAGGEGGRRDDIDKERKLVSKASMNLMKSLKTALEGLDVTMWESTANEWVALETSSASASDVLGPGALAEDPDGLRRSSEVIKAATARAKGPKQQSPPSSSSPSSPSSSGFAGGPTTNQIPPQSKAPPSTPWGQPRGDVAPAPAPAPVPAKARNTADPIIAKRAKAAGVRLEKFEGRGLEEQAVKELEAMIRASNEKGFLTFIKSVPNVTVHDSMAPKGDGAGAGAEAEAEAASAGDQSREVSVSDLLKRGEGITEISMRLLARGVKDAEDLTKPPLKLPVDLKAGGLRGGMDIFEGPPITAPPPSSIMGQQLQAAKRENPIDPATIGNDEKRLSMLLGELARSPVDVHPLVLDSYRDLLLSNNILHLLRRGNQSETDYQTRQIYAKITGKAFELTTELSLLAKTEAIRHLETIHDVCSVAAKYQQDEEEFLARIDRLRPRFDTELLAYLKYAVGEEEDKMRGKGLNPAELPSSWLQVLRVVYQGVLADFESRYERILNPLILVIRFEQPEIRRDLLERFARLLPAVDLPYMRALACNMAEGVISTAQSGQRSADEAVVVDDNLVKKLTQLRADVDEVLGEEVLQTRLGAFEAEAANQGKKLVMRHRNPSVEAAQEAEAALRRRGGTIAPGGFIQSGVGENVLDTSQRNAPAPASAPRLS